ncbi:translation initiation factor eIF-2B subunit delta [Dorcoceras hygrometricum]|uniref:Translation initiation factor eIF-2B subunit delta n=1 Tax=Dorcoceras hygrometricum TaxID=472368 RepID=A0A2Z7AX24_9LAMI|nr:translation initiation factor eIF-2B subunit delta [Dorcoceras hygrometricum]
MNEEVTRVSQHFGVLTIGFSSCASGGRSADVDCVVMFAADQQARKDYSARMNEEVTRVSQHFGVLTIGFSSCASGGRSADVDCVVMFAADQQARKDYSVEKRRRLNYLKRCVLSFSFERSAVGSNVYVSKMTSFGLVDASTF